MRTSRTLKIVFFISLILSPQFLMAFPFELQDQWDYSMISKLERSFNLFEHFNATSGFKARQSLYLNSSRFSDGFYAQSAHIFVGDEVNDDSIINSLDRIYARQDCCDFTMNGLIRMLYLNLEKDMLAKDTKDKIADSLGNAKYWYSYPEEDTAIFTTENHQILYHTAEYLAGQLFPNTTFVNSGIKGKDHVEHAKPLVLRWLDWRARFGFSEWHSNTYYVEDISPLLNLADFALDEEIATKAAMILDIMAFDFATNYYKNVYGTTMGRCYDSSRISGTRDSISEVAWMMLGIEDLHNPCDASDMAAVALATSKSYAPPPLIEDIYNNATSYFEGRERHSIYIDEGDKYDIEYNSEDLDFWFGMQAHLDSKVIAETYQHIEDHNRNPMTLAGPQALMDYLRVSAFLHGTTISEYAKTLELIFRGVTLQTANCYTYRTPYYQLSGAQDHMKGLNSAQEHIWQATLDREAYVFTSSPGGYVKDLSQKWMGGFKPRAVFHENIGIIQYDRKSTSIEGEVAIFFLNLAMGGTFYQHAYFPRSAFDKVIQKNGWTLGEKNDAYIALYSYEATQWMSDFELRVNGRKNVWVVELGSKEEHGSFDDFVSQILDAKITIEPRNLGYDVTYDSPSQGKSTVGWGGAFKVDGEKIDLGDYDRFENAYCHQEFGTQKTFIEFEAQRLELNFENASRIYQN